MRHVLLKLLRRAGFFRPLHTRLAYSLRTSVLCVLLCVVLSPQGWAETSLRPVSGERWAELQAARAESTRDAASISRQSPVFGGIVRQDLAEVLDGFTTTMIVPYFEVDTSKGKTTLFAVYSEYLSGSTRIAVAYHTVDMDDGEQRVDLVTLEPGRHYTVNLRDVGHLRSDPDGTKRGFVRILQETGDGTRLQGDYFQIDTDQSLATGDAMYRQDDICGHALVRYLPGKTPNDAGTRIILFFENPLGASFEDDPPTACYALYDENGNPDNAQDIFTDDNVYVFDLYSPLNPFGAFDILFSEGGGFLGATYTAEGRYSIGLQGGCVQPAPL